jgi:2-keto-4-pentenoate hydratase
VLREDQRAAAADALYDASEHGVGIAPLSEMHAGVDVEDAYEVQLGNVRRRYALGHVNASFV